MIYKLKHPDPSKGGFVAGVDFCGGFGTTNSLEDAEKLARIAGCEITTLEGRPVQVIKERMKIKLPGSPEAVETGPVLLRAVVNDPEIQDKGAAAAAPASYSPEVQLETKLEEKPKEPNKRGKKPRPK